MARPMCRAGRVVVAALVGIALAVAAPGGRVSAHASLESSSPAANSVLEQAPTEIVLDFDEAVEGTLASIRLFSSDGTDVGLGEPRPGDDDTVVTAAVPAIGDGLYAVVWRVVSADGHVVDGAFSFQVGTAAVGDGQALVDRVRDGAPSSSVAWWYGAARFFALLGIVVLVGAGWWALQGDGALAERATVRRLLHIAATVLLVASMATFALFGARVAAGTLADAVSPSVWSDAARSATGRALLVRLSLSLVAVGLLLRFAARRQAWWRGAAMATAALALATFPAAGHARAQHPLLVWMAVDWLHLTAIAIWLGGLLLLVCSGRRWLAEPPAVALMRRFSATASLAVPVIVATGVAQTLRLTDGLDDITATSWGRLLLTKIVIVAGLLSVAAVSHWLLRHFGPVSLSGTVVLEAIAGVAVVALAAGMVALPPRAAVTSRPFAGQLAAAGGLLADVTIDPGRVGSNTVHIVITPPGGSIIPVVGVTARVSLPAAGIPVAPVTLVSEGPNHYSGEVSFVSGGDWTFEIVVQVTDSDSALLKETVSIP